jgi:hypothetical protein
MTLSLDAMTAEKTKVRKVKQFAQGHAIMKCPSRASSQGLGTPGAEFVQQLLGGWSPWKPYVPSPCSSLEE